MEFDAPNARLTEDLEEPTFETMRIGEIAWSVPWAMEIDTERRCWLKSSFSSHEKSGGTVTMQVGRVSEGFIVNISLEPDYKWNTRYALDASELDEQDPENPTWLPVIEIFR